MDTTTKTRPPEAPAEANLSGVLLFMGVALAILGIIAIAAAAISTFATVILFGVLMIAAAIAEFVHAFKARGARGVGWSVLSGIIYLITGALMLYNPLLAAISLTALLGSFFLVAGVVRIVRSIQLRHRPNWGWLLFSGIVDLVLGFLIWSGWPTTGLWVIGLFVGIEMLVHGIATITLSAATDRVVHQHP